MNRACAILAAALLAAGCASGGPRHSATSIPSGGRASGAADPGSGAEPSISIEEYENARELPPAAARRGPARPAGRVRLTLEEVASAADARADQHASFSMPGFRCVIRAREASRIRWAAGYATARAARESISLHAGSFVPSFAGGLVAGGSGQTHVFSSSFPFGSRQPIAPNTSLFGAALVGGAVEIKGRSFAAIIFGGRERVARSGRLEVGSLRSIGGRVEARSGSVFAGMSAAWHANGRGNLSIGGDLGLETAAARAMLETALSRSGVPAACAAFSSRRGDGRFGALLYAVPAGFAGPLSRVGGRDLGSGASYAGAAASAEKRFLRRGAARAAVEHVSRADDRGRGARSSLKIEIEKRTRRARIVLSSAAIEDAETPLLPYPSASREKHRKRLECGALLAATPLRTISARFALRAVVGPERARGILFSPTLKARRADGRAAIAAYCVIYRASGPAPACYYYEPSMEGAYPWRAAYRGIRRGGIVITYNYNKIELSCKASLETDSPLQGGIQAVAEF